MTKEEAVRFIKHYEIAAARNPEKRSQHLEAARYLREQFGLPVPPQHPPADEIFAELLTLGMSDCLQDFWRFHEGQSDPAIGASEYQKAHVRLRKLALIACRNHKRKSVWVPECVGYSQPYKFVEVKPLERGEFKQIEVTT